MKARYLKSVFAALVIFLMGSLPTFAFEVDGIYYYVLDKNQKTCAVSSGSQSPSIGTGDTYKGDIVIPASVIYNGESYAVVQVGHAAFFNCKDLTSVVLPNSIKEFKSSTAFQNCVSLKSINIPTSITEIPSGLFEGCTSLESITIPRSVTSLYMSAFEKCTSLKSITIPKSVTSISSYAAFDGLFFESITVEDGNPKYDSRESCNAIIETETNKLVFGCCKTVIPSSVKTIGFRAFEYCANLTNILFPNTLETIEGEAFGKCALTMIHIPASVTSIANNAFYSCSDLETITVDEDNPVYDSRNNCNAIIETATNTLWKCSKNTVIPTSVTNFSSYAGISSCKNLFVPKGVTELSSVGASYESIVVEEGNPVYDSRNNCNALIETKTNTLLFGCANTVIPNTVTSIAREAFENCQGLTSINIPSSVKSVGDWAFYKCYKLSSVTIEEGVEEMSAAFRDCTSLISVVLPNSLKTVSSSLFSGCENLTSVVLPNKITTIESFAFSCCKNLKNMSIPSTVKTIERDAFEDCSSLIRVDLPNGLTEIGEYAFSGCSGLTSFYIPATVTSIGEGVLQGCSGLYAISVDSRNKKYDSRKNCNALIETETNKLYAGCINTIIPDDVITIGCCAFSGIKELTSINLPESIYYIGDNAFEYCENLESITFPPHLQGVSSAAFEHCKSLKSVHLPSECYYIGYFAFYGCENLEEVTLPGSLFLTDFYMFYECPKLNNIYNYSTRPSFIQSTCFSNYNATMHVMKNYKDVYQKASVWDQFYIVDDLEYENAIYTDRLRVKGGQRIKVPIMMKNTEAITGFQFELETYTDFNIARDEDGELMVELADERAADTHMLSYTQLDECYTNKDSYKFVCLSTDNSSFKGNEGPIMYITFEIPEDFTKDELYLEFQNEKLTTSTLKTYANKEIECLVNISECTPGDLDNDGEITVADAIGVINVILDTNTENLNCYAADVNKDGEVTVSDAVGVVNIILYGSITPPAEAKSRQAFEGTIPQLNAGSLYIPAGSTRTLYLHLNAPSSFTGIQFDVNLPKGLSFVSDNLTCDKKHSITSAVMKGGTPRVVCFSLANSTFLSNDIIGITIKADEDIDLGEFICSLENVKLSGRDAQNIDLPMVSFSVSTDATSIEGISNARSESVIYDINGRKLNSSDLNNQTNGMFIINGQKILK